MEGKMYIEKVWHQSKKFLAFLIMEAILGGLAFYLVFSVGVVDWPMVVALTCLITNATFTAIAFNAKQAELDRYIRFVALTGHGPEKTELKGVEHV